MSDIDWITRANIRAKGRRPRYADDPAIDRLTSIVLALAGEVAVNRERMDTIERLLDTNGTLSRADIEAFRPDRAAGHARGLLHREMIARVLRAVQQDMEAATSNDPLIDEVAESLASS